MAPFNRYTFGNMSKNYCSLLKSGKLSDVVLVAGKKGLRAHKLVLSARSPVFAAMFAHDSTKEAQVNRVEIVDVNEEVLELLVRYIYTGKVWMLDLYGPELLVAACKYQLASLKSICVQQLLSKVITPESVSNLLIHADKCQVTELTSKCVDYITDNVTQVMASRGWKQIVVKPDLVNQLFELLNSKYLSKAFDGDGEKKEKLITIPFKLDSFDSLIFEEMAKHYESLLKRCNQSDVVLVVSGKELRVHKVILSARSPVFAAMFAHSSIKEAQESRVEIIDIDLEAMELLVRYIYTGKVGTLGLNAMDLLVAADKYQVDCLKSICEQQLLSQAITTDSVSDLLILADMHQVTELTAKCLDYITDNATQVMASKGWKNISVKAELVVKLFELLNVKYSKVIYVGGEDEFGVLSSVRFLFEDE